MDAPSTITPGPTVPIQARPLGLGGAGSSATVQGSRPDCASRADSGLMRKLVGGGGEGSTRGGAPRPLQGSSAWIADPPVRLDPDPPPIPGTGDEHLGADPPREIGRCADQLEALFSRQPETIVPLADDTHVRPPAVPR